VKPVRPDTVARSLAIGNPADGDLAVATARASHGAIHAVAEEEVGEGMALLAETTGVFGETAAGVTLGALRETVARFEGDTGIVSSFEGDLKRPVPRDVETLAYRIVQESLTNIGKHAKATTVMVHLDTDDNQLRVEVEDDGQGFEAARARGITDDGASAPYTPSISIFSVTPSHTPNRLRCALPLS